MKLALGIALLVFALWVFAWIDIATDGVMVAEDIAWCDRDAPCD